jgi:hypothetical protein
MKVFLAGLEEGHELVLDKHRIAGARIAPLPRRPVLDREGAEAAQLDPVATGQRSRDLIENDVDDALDVALEEVWVGCGHPLNQLRLDHERPTSPAGQPPTRASCPQGAKGKQDRQA